MKRDEFRDSATNQQTRHLEDETASDRPDDSDMQVYESSAEVYERRWRHRRTYDRRDWWIAVAVYTLLASVAFVIL